MNAPAVPSSVAIPAAEPYVAPPKLKLIALNSADPPNVAMP
jgi:hypothetical protein